MRIKEVISEARGFSNRKSTTMVATYAFPDMPSNNPYKAYRFAMAMANHKIKNEVGPVDEFAVISAYTEGEEEIINDAVKTTGNKKVLVSDKKSHEPEDTNIQSPVAKSKKNKYGV